MADAYGKDHGWSDAMKHILKFEGGKDDDPRDPGGRTNQGVIQRVYTAWRKRKGLPNRDVFLMENTERDQIYWEGYGQKVRFNELPPGVDLVVLDGGVNSGPGQSIKWLQRALGIGADGVLGDLTLQRTLDYPDHDDLIRKIITQRDNFLRALKTFKHFGRGWISRTSQVRKIGQAWAMGTVGPEIVWVSNMNKKATIVDAKPRLSTAPADATAAGGTVTTGISTVQGVLDPMQGMSSTVDHLITALIVAGVIATIFGIGYAWWVRKRNAELEDALDTAPISQVGANDNDEIPLEVKLEYKDQTQRGSETGNMAPGTVTTSGRTEGDGEERVNAPVPLDQIPEIKKQDAA